MNFGAKIHTFFFKQTKTCQFLSQVLQISLIEKVKLSNCISSTGRYPFFCQCLTSFEKASHSIVTILTWKKNFFRKEGDPSRSGNWCRIRVSLVEESYQDAESSSLPINSSPLKYPGLALSKPYSNCSKKSTISFSTI